MVRRSRLPAILALLALLALWQAPARSDLAFQAVEEWAPFTFRYPSGRFRIISEGAEIQAFNRAWSDTTGQGIPFDRYFSHVDEDGDSVGVFVWIDLPAGKYFFVETLGTDSTFTLPDFSRQGFDLAPPASVDSSAIIDAMILTRHLDPDSIISDPKYIASGVVRSIHVAPNLDGAKLLAGSVDSTQLAAGAALRNIIAGGSEVVDLRGVIAGKPALGARLDSLLIELNLTVWDSLIVWGNVVMDSDYITLGNSPVDEVQVTGDLYVLDYTTLWDHVTIGNVPADTLGVWSTSTFHDSVAVGYSFTAADSQQYALRLADGFLAGGDIVRTFTMPSLATSKLFQWPGVTADCECIVQENATSPHSTGWSCITEAGWVKVWKTAGVGSDREIDIVVFCH